MYSCRGVLNAFRGTQRFLTFCSLSFGEWRSSAMLSSHTMESLHSPESGLSRPACFSHLFSVVAMGVGILILRSPLLA